MDPASSGGLEVFGLRRASVPEGPPYRLLDDSLASGEVEVSEVGAGGSVPELKVTNRADGLLLLFAGEELVGAKQNRVLNSSLLVAARSDLVVPVSCVESGRWQTISSRFGSRGTTSHSKLRAMMSDQVSRSYRSSGTADSDQSAVWEEVDRKLGAMKSSSPSRALHKVYEDHRLRIDGVVEALRPPEGASGAVFVLENRVAGMDLFDRPETLSRVWTKLLRGYAVDLLEEKPGADGIGKADVEAWLRKAGDADGEPFASPGVGSDVRLSAPDLVGASLVHEGRAVHTQVFSRD
jgi:hypothetical protein